MRDIGRTQAYRAERRIFCAVEAPLPTARFSETDVRAMVAEIVPNCAQVTFYTGNGHAWARGSDGQGALHFTTRRGTVAGWIVLHECAHLLAPFGAKHGPAWRTVYVGLVKEWIGDDAARMLADAFATEPLRRAPSKRRKFRIVVRETGPARLVSIGESHPTFEALKSEYEYARSALRTNERLWTRITADGVAEYSGRAETSRPATAEEIRRIPPHGRARMRNGETFYVGAVSFRAEEIRDSKA